MMIMEIVDEVVFGTSLGENISTPSNSDVNSLQILTELEKIKRAIEQDKQKAKEEKAIEAQIAQFYNEDKMGQAKDRIIELLRHAKRLDEDQVANLLQIDDGIVAACLTKLVNEEKIICTEDFVWEYKGE